MLVLIPVVFIQDFKNKPEELFDEDMGKYDQLYLSHWDVYYNFEEVFNIERMEQNIIL